MKVKKEIGKILNNLKTGNVRLVEEAISERSKAIEDIYALFGWLPIEQIDADKLLGVEVRLYHPSTGIIEGRLVKYLKNDKIGYEWVYGKHDSRASIDYFNLYQQILYPEG